MRLFARLLAMLAAAMLAAQPVAAQSILRDAETEAFLDEISAPLIEAAGLQPDNVDIILINDPSINAFVAGGQAVYIHSGLIDAADTAEEVQGVIAHELGHITGGHILRYGEGMASATKITVLSLLAGLGAALVGAGDAAMGIMMAGQQAAMPELNICPRRVFPDRVRSISSASCSIRNTVMATARAMRPVSIARTRFRVTVFRHCAACTKKTPRGSAPPTPATRRISNG